MIGNPESGAQFTAMLVADDVSLVDITQCTVFLLDVFQEQAAEGGIPADKVAGNEPDGCSSGG